MSLRRRVELSLEQKVELIRACAGKSQRQLALEFGIGKTQVQSILKRKADILDSYDDNGNSSRKRSRYANEHEDIDELTWRWFQRVRAMNTPISGPMIQQQALDFAKHVNKPDFKASNGWLNRFKSRHNIGSAILSGERASVDQDTVDSWRERLPGIIKDFSPKDIYNMDETGLFFRALPDKTLTVRGSDCAGGKRSKDRITVAVCVNAVGEFETPLVIGHAAKPRCFRNISQNKLPVKWAYNKKAWMTGTIFQDWISQLNRKMRLQKRHVLLLIDNAPSHPHDLELSNITIRFLPANTTSVLQPLDLGIIKNIKCHYRTRLLRSVLAKLETSESASDVAKSVSVLDACSWVASAVREVKPETVVRCFAKAGVHPQDDVDFDADDDVPLAQLYTAAVEQLQLANPLSVQEYTDIDAEVPSTEDLEDGWQQRLVEELVCEKSATSSDSSESSSDGLQDDETETQSQPQLEITTFSQALHWATQLKLFAVEHGHESLFDLDTAQEKLEKTVVEMKSVSKQSKISSFFKAS